MADAPAATKREKAMCYFRSKEMAERQRLGDAGYLLTDEYKMWYCETQLKMSVPEAINVVATPDSQDSLLGEHEFLTETVSPEDYEGTLPANTLGEIAARRQAMIAAEHAAPAPDKEDHSEVTGTPLVAKCEWCDRSFTGKRPDLSLNNHRRACKENTAMKA